METKTALQKLNKKQSIQSSVERQSFANLSPSRFKNEEVGVVPCFSYYDGLEPVNEETAFILIESISQKWPEFSEHQLQSMAQIFIEDQWPVEKVKDAIKYFFKTQRYNPRPADILRFDKNIELFTQLQTLEMGASGFIWVFIPGHPRRIRNGDTLPNAPDAYIDAGWYIKSGIEVPESWSFGQIEGQ